MSENLDDLILTEPAPKKGKQRGILVIMGLILILLIGGLILFNLVLGEGSGDGNTTKGSEEVIQDTASLNTTQSDFENQNDSDLAPIANATPQVATTAIGTAGAAAAGMAMANRANKKEDDNIIIMNGPNSVPDDIRRDAQKEDITPQAPKEEKRRERTQPKEVEKPKVHHKKAEVEREERSKRVEKPVVKHKRRGSIYIQVGSFTKGPARDFISKIRKAGFKFRIKRYSDGYRRVYVGPFKNREEARRVLGDVRAKINPDAFVKGRI